MHLMQDEKVSFHLSTLKLSYDEVVQEYENRANTKLGKLIANRELPILNRVKEIIDEILGIQSNLLLEILRTLEYNPKYE